MSGNWNDVGKGFCENLIYGYPEYANALSSWFISLIGLYGLFYSSVNLHILRWVYSLYAWAGVGSFLFHWYGYRFYGQLDTIPLLLASWFIVYEAWRVLLEGFKCYRRYYTYTEKLVDVLALGCTMALALTLAARNVTGRPWGMAVTFTKAFAIPQLLAVGTIPFFAFLYRDLTVRRYMLSGFLIAVVSAVIWLATEPYCRVLNEDGELKYPVIQYLYTHVIWHIGIIWGGHILLQCLVYFDYVNTSTPVEFYTSGRRITRIFLTLFPIVGRSAL